MWGREAYLLPWGEIHVTGLYAYETLHDMYISLFAETAAPLMACSGCQLLDTIHFCSTVVYSRLVTEMQRQPSKFFFQPDNCFSDTATGRNLHSIGPDCMPRPEGLRSGTGAIVLKIPH
jgi:hypothetical protein